MAAWSVSGKTVVVTGANIGIGKETARAMAKSGARTILVCRSEDKGRAALEELRADTGSEHLSLELCDFSSQASIRAFAARFTVAHDRLDVLINNAGLLLPTRHTTDDGLETTFATNHLGYFLTTHLLLDLLKKSAPSRIVVVASEAHRRQKLDFDDLQAEKSYDGLSVYGRSKLANIYFTYELAERIEGSGVTANCLHPGVVGTDFGKKEGGLIKLALSLAKPFLLSAEKGAATQIYLAESPEVSQVSGKYFDKKRPIKSSRESMDVAARKRLWDVSEKLVGLRG